MLSDQALELMNVAQMSAQQAESEARLEEVHRADEYYEGRTEAETVSYFAPEMIVQIAFGNNNITQRIIKRISLVHKLSPITIFPEGTKENVISAYGDATPTKNAKMSRAERMLNLHKMIFLKSTFRGGKLEVDIIKDFVPLFGDDPMHPIAVTYPIHASSEVTNTDAERWAFWSADEQFIYEKGGSIIMDAEDPLQGSNPYGIFPGVFCFAEGAPPETSFMDVRPAMDLVETNLAINLAITEMNANIRFQNFDYPFLKGIKNAGDVKISQDKFTELPPGVEMGIVGFNSHVPDTITGVGFMYKSIAQNYGLTASFAEGTQAESGRALYIRQQELLDNRSGDLENWRSIWAALYAIEKQQMKYHFKTTMPDEMNVDFRESMKVQTEAERRDDVDWMVETGQTTYAQVLLDSNPDAFPGDEATGETPLQQAQAFMIENLKKNSLAGAASTIPSPLALALGEKPTGELE